MHTQENRTLVNGKTSIIDRASGCNRRTSIRLERIEWSALQEICREKDISINEFCCEVDRDDRRREHSRASRIRSAIFHYFLSTRTTLVS